MRKEIADLLGVSKGRMMNLMEALSRDKMAYRIRIGETAEERQGNGTRLCVGTEGLRYLARIDRRRASIRPDATFDLNFRVLSGYFVLEYEVQADRPSRMDDKLSRYERYYDGMATRFDFDRRRPAVLMVFRDIGTASRFLTYTGEATGELPMLVSSLDVLREKGVTGMAWRSPWRIDMGEVSLRVDIRG